MGNKRLAADWNLKIDEEFRGLLPEHSQEERALFEDSLLQEGCRDAVVVWKGHGIIVDGHHRAEFCGANGIPFDVTEMEFEDRNAAKEWILKNQLSRRNLPMHERARIALAFKPIIEARAEKKLHLSEGRGKKGLLKSENLNTQKELAKIAGVGTDTIAKVGAIERSAPAPIRDASRRGEISVNAAYQVTKMAPEKQTEVVKQINEGKEATKKIISKAVEEMKAQAKEQTKEQDKTEEERDHHLLWSEFPESTEAYVLEDYLEEIAESGDDYINNLRILIARKGSLFTGDEATAKIREALKNIIDKLTKIEEEYDND